MCFSQAADILATGIVAGAFAIGTFALHPAAARLEPPQHILLRQELIRRLSRFLPPFMLLPLVTAPVAMMFCRLAGSWPSDMLGLALSFATVAITVTTNAPLNRRFAKWSPTALPTDWHRDIRRWNRAHTLRMTTAVGAFASAILAGR
jgi:uncharacterized membrane protein